MVLTFVHEEKSPTCIFLEEQVLFELLKLMYIVKLVNFLKVAIFRL